jgi:glycine betaine/proline transport system permease protein
MPRLYIGNKINDAITWLLNHFSWLFNLISSVTSHPVSWLQNALTGPPMGLWVTVFTALGVIVRGWWFGLGTCLGFLLIDSLRLWTATMQTLAVVVFATVIAAATGIPLGIWSARRRLVSLTLRPILDFMQTLPVFLYLIPAVFFFGVGVVPGIVSTTIFAIPPAVRLTELGIRQVDPEVVEAAQAFGASPSQVLRDVQLPLALPTIMAGVNQVIMLALSMVVVAGLAGADGLGVVVVRAVTQLDVASGFEGGIAVVVLAMFLDRLTSALAEPHHGRRLLSIPPLRLAGPRRLARRVRLLHPEEQL